MIVARPLALLVIFGIVVGVQRIAPVGTASSVALPFGFSLIAAYLLGGAAELVRLPRLSGYLLFGLLCGPYLLNLITASMARDLQLVNGLAISLIALIAGIEINVERLRARARAIAIVSAVTLGVMYAVIGVLLFVAWPWLPIAPDAGGLQRLSMVIVLTAITASFSPTVIIAVVAESRARGPLAELVIATAVLADLALILVFTLVMQLARTIAGGGVEGGGLLVHLSWEIFGSLAFGGVVGGLFALYLRLVGRELTLVLLALCVILSQVGRLWHLEPLLASLAAGLVIENIAPARADALRDAVERSALPVLILFFAAAGASLQLDALAVIGVPAVAVAIVRVVSLRAGARMGLRAAGLTDGTSQLLWTGLVSQAGVTLGLGVLVAAEFPEWGRPVQTLIVALSGLHVLVGPILFRNALVRAGEVGRLDGPPAH
ncbi:MAG: cation:proton antiporter [Vicinamibacterales bacterium]